MKLEMGSGRGLSPFISSVLTILFGIIMLGIVLNVVGPTFNRAQDSSIISDAFQNLNLIDAAIKEVASEAQGSKRTIPVSVSGGQYISDSDKDALIFEYEPSEEMGMTGMRGDIHIQQDNIFADFFNWYVNGDKADPVWVNTTGEWVISDFKYRGESGFAYHNLGTVQNGKYYGKIYNIKGNTDGQIFMTTHADALKGYWTFDKGGGDRAYDWSGRENNGTREAASDFPSTGNSTSGWQDSGCKGGESCMRFDGVNDYIKVGDGDNLDFEGPGEEFTVSFWLRPHVTSSNQGLLYKSDNDDDFWRVNLDSDNKITCSLDSIDFSSATGVLTAKTWHHIACVFNKDEQGQVYVDGSASGSGVNLGGEILSIDNQNLYIGSSYAAGSPSNYFNGTIDEVKIWSTSLTADEVAAEYGISAKKLYSSGFKSAGVKIPNAAVALSNPDGVTGFDDIKVDVVRGKQTLILPYSKIDINGSFRIGDGEHKITIEHMGTNVTLGEPIIEVVS